MGSEDPKIAALESEVRSLKTRLRHLSNELTLTREESQTLKKNYYRIFTRLEEQVVARTGQIHEVQKKLSLQYHELQLMLDSIPEIVFYQDPEGKYVRVNAAFVRAFDLGLKDIIGRTNDQIPLCRDNHVLSSSPGSPYALRTVINSRKRLFTSQGERSVLVTKLPYKDVNGTLTGIFGFIMDVTEIEEAESLNKELQLRVARAEKMEALGILAGGVAHDGNNIIGGIMGNIQLALMDIPEQDPSREYLESALTLSRRMAEMVQDLLSLARGGVKEKYQLNLNEVLGEISRAGLLGKLCEQYPDVEVAIDLADELPGILGQVSQIEKLIMNLVTNAAEAMPEGGTILVATRHTKLSEPKVVYDRKLPEGEYIVLEVSDSGVGIPKEIIGHIFEPFYTKKKMRKSGSGLGLAVVYGTMNDHGGYIDLRSTPGKGTTFTLYFPRSTSEEKLPRRNTGIDQLKGEGERILVVDDLSDQRRIAAEMLKKLNYTVDTVASGEEALEYVKARKPDLLLLDMVLESGMDGVETFRSLLGIHPEMPAIIASGYTDPQKISECRELGAGSYIQKPYTLEEIAAAVKQELTPRSHGADLRDYQQPLT